jgi:hypothetical protein
MTFQGIKEALIAGGLALMGEIVFFAKIFQPNYSETFPATIIIDFSRLLRLGLLAQMIFLAVIFALLLLSKKMYVTWKIVGGVLLFLLGAASLLVAALLGLSEGFSLM